MIPTTTTDTDFILTLRKWVKDNIQRHSIYNRRLINSLILDLSQLVTIDTAFFALPYTVHPFLYIKIIKTHQWVSLLHEVHHPTAVNLACMFLNSSILWSDNATFKGVLCILLANQQKLCSHLVLRSKKYCTKHMQRQFLQYCRRSDNERWVIAVA